MKSVKCLGFAVVALTLLGCPSADLTGRWSLTVPLGEFGSTTTTREFLGNSITVTVSTTTQASDDPIIVESVGTFSTNLDATPKEIDFTLTPVLPDGIPTVTTEFKGIFEIIGNTLRIADEKCVLDESDPTKCDNLERPSSIPPETLIFIKE